MPPMRRMGFWFAVALLTMYLVFVSGSWQGTDTPWPRSLSVALAALVVAIWGVVAWRRPPWRPRSVLLPAIASCIGSLAISTLFSRHPRLGVEYLGYAIILAALYLLLVRILADPWFRVRMSVIVTVLGPVIGLAFLVLAVSHWVDWWRLVGRLTVAPFRPNFESLVFGNPSAVMMMSVLLTAAGLASIGLDSPRRRTASVILVVIAGLVALLSGSRGGWFGVAIAVTVTAALWLQQPARRESVRSAASQIWSSTRSRIAVGGLGAGGILGLVAFGPAILSRVESSGGELRGAFVTIAFRLFAESPIVGVGPGVWVASRSAYTIPPEIDYYIPHAHSIWAQTAAELGIVGILAGAVVIGTLAWLIRDGLRDVDTVRRRWAWIACFVLVYLGVHQLFDFYANAPEVMFAGAIPIAFLDAGASARVPSPWNLRLPTTLSRRAAAAASVMMAASIAGLIVVNIPAERHAEAVALANDGQWAEALELATDAASMDPGMPPYQMTVALAALRIGDNALAADQLRAVLQVDDLPEAWLALGLTESRLGRGAGALADIRRALRLGYQRPAIAMAAGDLALQYDKSTATAAFAAAIATTPSLAGDPYWTKIDSVVAANAIKAAMARSSPSGVWEIELETGDAGAARQTAHGLDPASEGVALAVIAAWNGDATARQAVYDRCAAAPLDVGLLVWCGRLAGRAGDRVTQDRYLAWVNVITGASQLGAELRVSRSEVTGRATQGGVAEFWGEYTYRRPTPWDLLAGDLLHLTLE